MNTDFLFEIQAVSVKQFDGSLSVYAFEKVGTHVIICRNDRTKNCSFTDYRVYFTGKYE